MKKVLVLAASLFAAGSMFAQVSFGPKLGLNLSNLSWKQGEYGEAVNTQDPGYKMNIGWQFGGIVNIQAADAFAVRTGLVLNRLSTSEKVFPATVILPKEGIEIVPSLATVTFSFLDSLPKRLSDNSSPTSTT